MTNLPESAQLFLDSNRGVYIPKEFAEIISHSCLANVTARQIDVLKQGPDHDEYWDVWAVVEDRAVVTNPTTGVQYGLYQDGDLWIIPLDAEWPDSDSDFATAEDIFIP